MTFEMPQQEYGFEDFKKLADATLDALQAAQENKDEEQIKVLSQALSHNVESLLKTATTEGEALEVMNYANDNKELEEKILAKRSELKEQEPKKAA
jgi:hypothetical protein